MIKVSDRLTIVGRQGDGLGDADLNLLAAGVPLFPRLGLRPRSWLALRETGVPRSREVDRDLQGKTDF